MKKSFAYFLVSLFLPHTTSAQSAIFPNNGSIFDRKLHSIQIWIDADSLTDMLKTENRWTDHTYPAMFIYDNTDTLKQVGFRLKGNTSRNAQRKGFRVDFDEFNSSQTFQGLKKFNINGNHNDPSMTREYLSSYAMQQAGVSAPRANPVKLFINGQYMGIRSNSEYVDKGFVNSRFGNKSGNLYKCSWPADLAWLGTDQAKYKEIINPSPQNERAYDLKTNESADDYTDLVNFINIINNSPNDSFPNRIERIFEVQSYLRALAMEVLCGHWDNYYANKNNYYLYYNTNTKKFSYIPYDMDNTYGVHWGFPDINKRNIWNWGTSNSAAPLTKNLLSHTQYQRDFEFYLKNLMLDAWDIDSLYKEIDYIGNLISDGMKNDPFYNGTYSSDYGFTFSDWQKSYTTSWGSHVAFGIKPYISDRISSTYSQFRFNNTIKQQQSELRIYPNPCYDFITLQTNQHNSTGNIHYQIFDIYGKCIYTNSDMSFSNNEAKIQTQNLAPGIYFIEIPQWKMHQRFIKQ